MEDIKSDTSMQLYIISKENFERYFDNGKAHWMR